MKQIKFLTCLLIAILLLTNCHQENQDTSHAIDDQLRERANTEWEAPPTAFGDALKVVDHLPLFGGCDNKECSDSKLIRYIQDHLQYPDEARAAGVEGRVFVQFIVETDGSVSNAYVAREVGGGTGEAALALVNGMNDLQVGWSSGIHKGKRAKVMFTLPITYELES